MTCPIFATNPKGGYIQETDGLHYLYSSILLYTVGLGIFCAKSNSRTKSANPDTLAKKRSAAGDQGVMLFKSGSPENRGYELMERNLCQS